MKIALATFKIWHFCDQGIGWSGPHKRLFTIENDSLSEEEIKRRVIREIDNEFYEFEGKLYTDKKENFEIIISTSLLG